MSNPNDLPLYLALYKHQKYLYLLINQFPKNYKYTLGEEIISINWQVLDLIILANCTLNSQKYEKINLAAATFDQLKARLRMAHELKLISYKKQAFIIRTHEEIGKMLSGWLKWAKKQVPN